MAKLDVKSTEEIKVSQKIADQVIGQDDAVRIIRKAANQRRHVLLIGAPGTGKSMLGLALAELLPKEKLVDVVAFPNPNDENQPMVRTLPAGQGRDLVVRSRMESMNVFKYQNVVMFVLLVIALISPWWAFNHYSEVGGPLLGGLMFIAFFLGGMVFFASFILFINLGRRVDTRVRVPRVIVDNFNKKQVPFFDATGAHAGALLGDVLHDPFQCFYPSQVVTKFEGHLARNVEMSSELDKLFLKNKNRIIKDEKDYEAIFLKKNELSVLGETNGSISPIDVLSANRHNYDGEMIKLTTSENKEIIVTPEHKIAIWKNNKIAYIEAKDIKEGDKAVSKAEEIIIANTKKKN
ncbi:ATP-binding protein [Candidatus Woesearchaeota archaeon]|nr:ATP-binding protein [Candidatus Woesearchaeota archaeon]